MMCVCVCVCVLRNPARPEPVKLFYKKEGWAEHLKRKHGDAVQSESPASGQPTYLIPTAWLRNDANDTSGSKIRALCFQ